MRIGNHSITGGGKGGRGLKVEHWCDTCKYEDAEWDERPCNDCTIGGGTNYWEPKEEQRWIPCSERLPDRFGKMLVTFIPAAGTLWTQVIIAHYSDLMGIARPCFWIGNVGKNDFANITSQVVAWMPLPEPWKGGEDE